MELRLVIIGVAAPEAIRHTRIRTIYAIMKQVVERRKITVVESAPVQDRFPGKENEEEIDTIGEKSVEAEASLHHSIPGIRIHTKNHVIVQTRLLINIIVPAAALHVIVTETDIDHHNTIKKNGIFIISLYKYDLEIKLPNVQYFLDELNKKFDLLSINLNFLNEKIYHSFLLTSCSSFRRQSLA